MIACHSRAGGNPLAVYSWLDSRLRGNDGLASLRMERTRSNGFHPAGAVIDAKCGVQHIFIYAGFPNGPAGVFRITRSLDTPKLVKLLNTD